MVALLAVAIALGLNNFGASIAIGVSGVSRRTGIKVATVFGLFDVVMPATGMLIGHRLAGDLGHAARWAGAGVLAVAAVYGLVEALRGDDDTPQAWGGWRLLISGAALSLDDLAVGLALGAVSVPIVVAVTAFGITSAVMSIIGLELGAKLGMVAGDRGEVVAGIVLICVAGAMAAGWLLPGREGRQDDPLFFVDRVEDAVPPGPQAPQIRRPVRERLRRSCGQPGYPAGLRASQTVRLVRTVRSSRADRAGARASSSAMSPALSLSSRPCRARQRVTMA
jgi:putative Mn2+ efflux pump MntP